MRAPIDVAPLIGRVDAASCPELVGRVRGLRALDAAFDVVRQAEERGRVAVGQRGDGRQRVVVRARPRDREAPHEVAAAVEDEEKVSAGRRNRSHTRYFAIVVTIFRYHELKYGQADKCGNEFSLPHGSKTTRFRIVVTNMRSDQ